MVARFSYDPLGRRQSKNIGGAVSQYLYDGPNIVQAQDGTGAFVANYLSGGIDEWFARQSATGTDSYLTDALGSTLMILDGAGTPLVSYTYDAYGNTTASTAYPNPFQYTGRENDGNGLYYYRARYYSPDYQRFVSSDPIGLNGGINLYAYVNGNPIQFIDPTGTKKLFDQTKFIKEVLKARCREENESCSHYAKRIRNLCYEVIPPSYSRAEICDEEVQTEAFGACNHMLIINHVPIDVKFCPSK